MDTFVNEDVKLGVVGCGKMASAILGGIVKKKFLPCENINVFDTNLEASGKLCREYGFCEAYSLKNLMESSDIILFAVKPFVINDILPEVAEYYKNQLILSILAGVKIEKYLKVLKDARIIRIMPNTPALVNEGASAICRSENVSNQEFEYIFDMMLGCGKVVKTTEDKIDVITALSGSGPAYFFKIIELMANSAQKLGLNKEEALLLSAQTALGSAKMVLENDFNIEQLIKNVTTPGGCTEVGNKVLLNSDIENIFDELIQKTMQKAIDLG